MKTVSISLILLIWVHFSYSQDFRNASWDMSQQEVRVRETFQLFISNSYSENNSVLIYKGLISGDSVNLWYQFLYDTLVQCNYNFYLSTTVKKPYTQLMKYLDILKIKYGEPDQVLWDWKDEDWKYILEKNPEIADSEFAYMYATGDIVNVIYQWEKSNMVINLSFDPFVMESGTRFPTIKILYQSCKYGKLMKRHKIKYSNDNF
jgi:hypothetical protein